MTMVATAVSTASAAEPSQTDQEMVAATIHQHNQNNHCRSADTTTSNESDETDGRGGLMKQKSSASNNNGRNVLPSPPPSSSSTPSTTSSSAATMDTSPVKPSLRAQQSLNMLNNNNAAQGILHELRRSSFTLGIPLEFGNACVPISSKPQKCSRNAETGETESQTGNDASFDMGSIKEDDDVIIGGSSSCNSSGSLEPVDVDHERRHQCNGQECGVGGTASSVQGTAVVGMMVNAYGGGGGGAHGGHHHHHHHSHSHQHPHHQLRTPGGGALGGPPNNAAMPSSQTTSSPTSAAAGGGGGATTMLPPHHPALMMQHQQQAFIPLLPQVGIPPPPLPPPHMLPPGAALPAGPPMYMPPPLHSLPPSGPGAAAAAALKQPGAQSPPQHWTTTPPPALIQPPNCQLRQHPFYTLTCEAAALAAAQIAAAGYHVTTLPNITPTTATTLSAGMPSAENSSSAAPPQEQQPQEGSTSGAAAEQQANNVGGGGSGSGGHGQQLGVGGGGIPLPPALMAAVNGGHDLFVHIHPGDSISLAVGSEIQTVQGPATIRMVSQNGPTQAIPLNVSQGHIVQQLLDRQGFLSHIIMSQEQQPQQQLSGSATSPNMLVGGAGGNRSGAGTPARQEETQQRWQQRQRGQQPSGGGANHHPQQQQFGGGQLSSVGEFNGVMPMPLASIVTNETEMLQHAAAAGTMIVPAAAMLSQGQQHFGCQQMPAPQFAASVAKPPQFEEPSEESVAEIEQDEKERLREMLNSVQKLTLLRVSAHDAEVVWHELDTSEAGASGGPFPHIDASEFQYELHLCECSGQQSPKCISLQRCPLAIGLGGSNQNSNVFCVSTLRPATDYEVRIRASLPERELFGLLSAPVGFRTNPTRPDAPPMPKMVMRQATSVHVQWRPPANNGSPIHTYFLQIASGKNDPFNVIYEGPNEQARITDLEPGAYYRLRVIAQNDYGSSECSAQLIMYPYEPQHHHQKYHHQHQQQHQTSSPSPSLSSSGSFYSAGNKPQQTHTFPSQQQQLNSKSASAQNTLSPSSSSATGAPTPLGAVQTSPSMMKPSPPTVHSVASRFVRLSWSVPLGVDAALFTLEMCEVRGPRGASFEPVPVDCYSASGSFATIQGLNSGREYRFRLSFNGGNEILHSEFVSVRTHKEHRGDHFSGTSGGGGSYQQQQQHGGSYNFASQHPPHSQTPALQTPQQLQRLFESPESLEIGWKYADALADHVSFVVEASCALSGALTSADDGALLPGSCLPQLQEPWRICYRGQATNCTVHDSKLCLFRVQTISTRAAFGQSAWSDVLVVKRQQQQTAGATGVKPQHHHQQPQQQQQNQHHHKQQQQFIGIQQRPKQQRSTQQPTSAQQQQQTVAAEQQQQTLSAATTVVSPPKPPNCSAPRLTALSSYSLKICWRLNGGGGNGSPKKSVTTILPSGTTLLFELQRVDKQPPTIVYSGNECEFELTGLKPAEHIQTRVRAVHLDSEGRRLESDWSGIGSACTKCDVPSAPRNVRAVEEQQSKKAGSTSATVALEWDAPAQLNGAAISEYLVYAERVNNETGNAESCSTTPLEKRQIGVVSGVDATTRFVATTLSPALRYQFCVVAVNEAGASAPSEPSTPLQTSPAVSEQPEALIAEPLSTSELRLKWQPPSSDNGAPVTQYNVEVFKSASGQHTPRELVTHIIVPQHEREVIVQALEPETDYEITLQAENAIGKSLKTLGRATTFAQPPEPPQIQLVTSQANQLKLKWGNPAHHQGNASLLYYFLEKENDNGTFSPVYEGELHTAKVRGLREQSTYFFRIRASIGKSGLVGPWSTKQAFSTTRQPPPALKQAPIATELSPGELFQIEWGSVRCPVQQHHNDDDSSSNDKSSLSSQQQFIYRLQIAPKLSAGREKTTEIWKDVYEGSSTMFTLPLSGVFTKQARVLVVQQWLDPENGSVLEESVSSPSPVTIFPVPSGGGSGSGSLSKSTSESPRKRSTTTGKKGRGAGDGVVAAPRPNRTSLTKRIRKFGSWFRKTVAEKEYSALIVLAIFVILALGIAFVLNNYYHL